MLDSARWARRKKFLALGTLVCLILFAVFLPTTSALALNGQAGETAGSGIPGVSSTIPISEVTQLGEQVVPTVLQSAQFSTLSAGVNFSIASGRSFGYIYSPGTPPAEVVTLFSHNELPYIEALVQLGSDQIVSMTYVNDSVASVAPETAFAYSVSSSPNYGGYSAQYCASVSSGKCKSVAPNLDASYANVTAPLDPSKPSGATPSCCTFAEWTGLTNTNKSNATLIQGGFAWSGFSQPELPSANYENYSLFTELYPSSPAAYFSPPGFLNGIGGQELYMVTFYGPQGSCPSGQNEWVEIWKPSVSSSSYDEQNIGCSSPLGEAYAWAILESPFSTAFCAKGGYDDYCQIPNFSSEPLYFMAGMCDSSGTCEVYNTNYNYIHGDYIEHTQQDTATSSIPASSGSWTETYEAST